MNQLEYVPGIGGASVQLDGPTSFVGIAENLRSREWEYDLGYRDLVSATRPAREVDVTFNADYATADDLRRVADADVTARTPGVFVAQQEWRQRGYILASQPNDIHYGRLSTELKVALLDGAWWRLVDKTFMPENTAPTYRSATGKSVTTVEAANVPLHALTVDGEAVQDGTPTPSAPVPIEIVQGNNLLPQNSTTEYSTAGWTIGGSSSGVSVHLPAGTYYISVECTTAASGKNLAVGLRNSSATAVGGVNLSMGAVGRVGSSVTIAEDAADIRAYLDGGAFKNFQIEHGSTATPFIPYGSIGLVVGGAATSIPLQGNVLASLPDGTRDVLTVDGAGHCVLEKRVGHLALKVSEMNNSDSWPGWTNCGARAIVGAGLNAAIPSSEIYCNIKNGSGVFGVNSTGQSDLGLLPLATYGLTQSQWQSQYPNLVINLMLKYATPQTIDLGYIDMPTMSDGAVVSITAEVTPTITAEWQTSPDLYLDYPHNYPYDYQKTSSTESITPSVLTPSDVRLVIYGPAVNPYVIVGDNRYQVNATVPSGGYLTVDGRDKSILLTLADGTVQNVFSSGVRGGGAGGGSYIFEKVPAGTSEVTYDGSFGFDLGWYEEEGEPPWSQS